MKYLSRVVWSEGMYLGPHHFQAQSRYFEDSIHFAASSIWFEPWGLVGAQVDAEALKNGTVSLVHARGILPDGMVFHMPEADALPEPRNIADLFPPARDRVGVMLAVPPRKEEGANLWVSENGSGIPDPTLRYRTETRLLHDETNGRDEKPVNVGRKNIRLLLDTEPPGDLITLSIARVARDGAGHFVLDDTFIPPCIALSASDRLMALLGRLIEILEDKSSRFSRAGGRSWSEFSTREIANFWLLHTVNSALAPLRHHYQSRRGHPEEAFIEMLRLGGALCTFAFDSHPRTLPLYDHKNLDRCFAELDAHIRQHLETIAPSQYIEIPFVKRADYFYESEVTDQRVLDRARWIFGVRSKLSEPELISRVPQLVKLCSKQFVPQLVKRALPGLALTHLPVPPSQIPVRADFQYFSVSRVGPCWDHISHSRELGLYVPGEVPDPEIELMVILES